MMNGSIDSATTVTRVAAAPGRVCPLRYRYGPAAIARAVTRETRALYVIGGLYGNLPALDTIEAMARMETQTGAQAPTLCFNGDFNWFNVDDRAFAEINRRVLANDAILGNVEAELDAPLDDAGCGCAYPDGVDSGVVERSNRIHARLKLTAGRHSGLLARIARLPMVARYRIADCRIGVVHGDAGMPNFTDELAGLCTRIATTRSPHPVLSEVRVAGAWVALLPVRFDTRRWQREFLAQWPAGTPAWESYFSRITNGPVFTPDQALGPVQARQAGPDATARRV